MLTVITIYSLLGVCLTLSFIKSKEKTVKAFKVAWRALLKTVPSLLMVLGALTLIPSLVAFPLAGSLLRSGATVMTISAFVTTLVMVGIVTAPFTA